MKDGHRHGRPSSHEHRRRLVLVMVLSGSVMIAEVFVAFTSNSLALLADAGHMLVDVAGIGLALFAIWLASRPSSPERSFGMYRVEILAAMVNALVLFALSAFVLVEGVRRWSDPPEVAGVPMLVVAVIGAAANAVSLTLLHRGQRESLNVRGAYLEVFGDLLGSAAVLVAAVVVVTTGMSRADAVASIVIGLLIVPRTWALLRDAVDVLLEATPRGIDLDEVRAHIRQGPGVEDVHDLHVWTITSGMNVVSAHVVVEPDTDPAAVLDYLDACLCGDFDIDHSTFQLESPDRRRLEQDMHD
jgi:cobalt-zinc-cadmium efflux system protein